MESRNVGSVKTWKEGGEKAGQGSGVKRLSIDS